MDVVFCHFVLTWFFCRVLKSSSKVVRKSIARVLTVINQNKKQAVRDAYADKVFLLPYPASLLSTT